MSKSQPQERPKTIYYRQARLKPGFSTQLGNVNGGVLYGSTKKSPTRYSIRWVPGLPMVFVQWLSNTNGTVCHDIPIGEFESFQRISEGDEPGPLKQ